MPIRTHAATIAGHRVYLRPPHARDAASFLAAVRSSRKLHGPWTQAPSSAELFATLVRRYASRSATARHAGFLVVRRDTHELAGVLNFSEMVRGPFRSTYLGYYAFHPHAGHGFMTEGMALALDIAFRRLKLHRVEVNVQPTNVRSVALAERVGFTREGFSRRYVKIAGRWRDHVRYAMLAEDWRALRKGVLASRAR